MIDQPMFFDPSGHPKPRKHGPKVYKDGPKPTGAARLQQQVNALLQKASRLERKRDADEVYARDLGAVLKVFVASHPRVSEP
jgi:hypothetical protein